MATTWRHQSNPEWLKERAGYLTSSKIAALWPETPTGKERKISKADYVSAIRSSQEVNLLEASSVGVRARGHVLEPYAINEFNARTGTRRIDLNHWDDCLIKKTNAYAGLAFSPDALDIPQDGFINPSYTVADLPVITSVGEVKSYDAKKHFATYELGKKAPECKQLAVGMYITHAQQGVLILYNPRLYKNCLRMNYFDAYDFAHEFEIIEEIERLWIEYSTELSINDVGVLGRIGPSEEEIFSSLYDDQALRID